MTLREDRSAPTTAPTAPGGATTTSAPPTQRSLLGTVLVLGAFVAIGPLTIDMYLPALPTITSELQTTEAAVQLTLTGTLVGLALGQLVLGPLSDALGRRGPLLAGTALHVVSSVLILFAPDIATLGVLRVLQGVGTSAGAVIALAVVRDSLSGRAAATMLSRLFLVIGAAPVLAPTIGGLVLGVTSWRGVFAVLAVYGVALLVLGSLALRETLPRERRQPLRVRSTVRTFGALLHDRAYLGLVGVAGLTMASLFSYVSGASFVYQEQFGLDQQQFAFLFGAGAVWLIGATQLNPVFLRRFEPAQVLLGGNLAALGAAVVLVLLATSGLGGIWGVALPLWAVLFAGGLALPNAPALALSRHGEAAGSAAALLGAVQFGVGALVSPLVGVLGNDATAMAVVILGSALAATAVLLVVVRPWRLDPVDAESVEMGHAAH